MTFFSIFYDLAIHLYALGSLPKMAWESLRKRKYRSNFFKRLGWRFPFIEKNGKPIVWVHAVSLGETKAVAPLIHELKKQYRILLSTTTETGFAEGEKSNPDYHVYLPFDFRYVIRPIVKRVRPSIVILTETDFWFHFQDAAKHAGAKLILVNGKISERSANRFAKFSILTKYLLQPIDVFCVQGDIYASRFKKLGIAEEKIVVTGNLKLDLNIKHHTSLKEELGITKDDFILTLGSTHDPEEKIWISHLKTIWKQFPQLKVMIVPRHPERFDEVASLLEKEGIEFERWTGNKNLKKKVLLVDAMGVLNHCYQTSHLAFVGGSLTERVGGHNILEPSFYGIPVLYGPYMHSQPDLLKLMQTHQAGIEVTNENISEIIQKFLNSPLDRNKIGDNGFQLTSRSKGALKKTIQAISI